MAVSKVLVLLATYFASAFAYIPAQATNQTIGGSPSDTSKISLQWSPEGSYSGAVSYQLVGADSSGISKGVLLHFSEQLLSNGITTTPWIALISCDANSTNASPEDDVFTLAHDRGAVAALLYSTTSESCYLNPEYSDPKTFDHVMDIYATQSRASSLLLEKQFFNTNNTVTYYFYPAAVNVSAAAIEKALANNNTVSVPGFLLATLTAFNATNASPGNTSGTAPPGQTTTGFQSIFAKSSGISVIIIAVIIVVGVIACLCAIGICQWLRRSSTRAKRRGSNTPESEHSTSDVLGTVEAGEAQVMTENAGGLVASSSSPASLLVERPDSPPQRSLSVIPDDSELLVDDADSALTRSDTGATYRPADESVPHTEGHAEALPAISDTSHTGSQEGADADVNSVSDSLSWIAPSTVPPSYRTTVTAAPSYHTRRLSQPARRSVLSPSPVMIPHMHPPFSPIAPSPSPLSEAESAETEENV